MTPHISQNEDVSEQTRTFTNGEQELFDVGFQSSVDFSAWKARRQKNLRASAAVTTTNPDAKRQRY